MQCNLSKLKRNKSKIIGGGQCPPLSQDRYGTVSWVGRECIKYLYCECSYEHIIFICKSRQSYILAYWNGNYWKTTHILGKSTFYKYNLCKEKGESMDNGEDHLFRLLRCAIHPHTKINWKLISFFPNLKIFSSSQINCFVLFQHNI